MTVPIGTSWKGLDGEDSMTDRDWHQRGHEQASALLATGSIEFANPDSEGVPTGGCYNGDYTEAEHAAANALLNDEYGEAEIESQMKDLYRVHQDQ
jgi:hypothetical protein